MSDDGSALERGAAVDSTSAPLLELDGISLRFGGVIALDDLSFSVQRGEVCGLIGPNGAGKTSAFNVICRVYAPQEGKVILDGQNVLRQSRHEISRLGIGRTFQNLSLFTSMTVLENVMAGADSQSRIGFGRAITRIGARSAELRSRDAAMRILEMLGMADLAHRRAMGLPFGTLKRIDLARALASNPKLLLLDEPASGLTHSEVGELGQLILQVKHDFDVTVLLVEHHMAMVLSICDRIVVTDFGRKIAEGTPDEIRNNPRVIEAYLGAA